MQITRYTNEQAFADEMNDFYRRFDTQDSSSRCDYVLSDVFVSRFNKICHPSQRPRCQVDKEAIGLSRVQQCSSTYNLPS